MHSQANEIFTHVDVYEKLGRISRKWVNPRPGVHCNAAHVRNPTLGTESPAPLRALSFNYASANLAHRNRAIISVQEQVTFTEKEIEGLIDISISN